MSLIISQKVSGLYGFKALDFEYQLTDTNSIEPILFVEVWINGTLDSNNTFEIEHYVSKNNNDYTYKFNIQNILLQHFSGVELSISEMSNFVNQADTFQCECFIRIYEYRENLQSELELNTSYVESNSYYIIKSNVGDLTAYNFNINNSTLFDFLNNTPHSNKFNLLDSKIGLSFWSNAVDRININGVTIPFTSANKLTTLNLSKVRELTGLENETNFLIYLEREYNSSGEPQYIRMSSIVAFSLLEFCDINNLTYVNQFGTIDNLLVEPENKGFNVSSNTFDNNRHISKYKSINNDTVNLRLSINNDNDIDLVKQLLVSNHVEFNGVAIVVENKGNIRLDRNTDDIILNCSYASYEILT